MTISSPLADALRMPLLLILLMGSLSMTTSLALAAENLSPLPEKTVGASKEKKVETSSGQAKKAKTSRDTTESQTERSTRLKRECRGAVNAGACSGYTD
jgi:hypothetical protein